MDHNRRKGTTKISKYKIEIGAFKKIPLEIINDPIQLTRDLTIQNPQYTASLKQGYKNIKVPEEIALYKMGVNIISVPRHFNIMKYIKKNTTKDDVRVVNTVPDHKININVNIQTKEEFDIYQNPIIDSIKDLKDSLIVSVVGSGKTVMALKLIEKKQLKTIVLVPLDSIREQWLDLFNNCTDAKVVKIQGHPDKDRSWEDCDLAVGTYHSFFNVDSHHEIFNSFGFLVADEVHKITATKFNESVVKFNSYRFGLTGTLDRDPELERMIKYHFGPVREEIKYEHTTQAIPKFIVERARCGKDPSRYIQLAQYFTAIWNDPQFQNDVIDIIKDHIDGRKKILILSDRRLGTGFLYSQLKDCGRTVGVCDIISKCSSGHVFAGDKCTLCGAKASESEKIVEKARPISEVDDSDLIIATEKRLGLGYNNEKIDTLILISGVGSREFSEQVVGRILRVHEGKQNPLVIEIVTSGPLEAASIKRHRKYRELGWIK